jgi:hypothetical protein
VRTDCDRAAGYDFIHKLGQQRGVCEIPELIEGGRNCEAAQRVCVEDFFCDGSNCIEARSAGAACSSAFECGEAGFCNQVGQCEERFAVDQACDDDAQCLSGICYEFEGESLCTDRIRLSRAEPLCDQLM